jgi:hypothetical protein
VEAEVGDLAVLDADVDPELVAAEWVVVVELEVVRVERPVISGVLVVLEDVVAVEGVYSSNTSRAFSSASTSRSTSSRVL